MSENRGKSSSKVTEGLASSKKPKNWRKAIFAVREIFQTHVYQTRGMACAVNDGSSIRLITWRGVVDNADRNSVVMDRFSEKVLKDVTKYRLAKSTVKTCGSFSFLSVNYSENFTILPCKVPGNAEINASELTAYSFSGEESIKLKFRYDKIKKEHELITTGDEWEKRVKEKTSLLGAPIVVGDKDKCVVGVVGVSDDGKIVPFFITKKEFDQAKNATEEKDEDKEQEQEQQQQQQQQQQEKEKDHKRNQTDSVNSTSLQSDKSSFSKDFPDAGLDAKFGSVPVSGEKVRSGAIPIEYLPYLALDIQSSKKRTSLGRTLGVDDPYLIGIDEDQEEDYERCYKMLKCWYHQSGTASFKDLAKALAECNLDNIGTQYCYEENDPPTQKYQKVSGKLKAGCVSNRDLLRIAHAVEGRRKRLGRALGVSDNEIDSEVEQNRSNVSEQSYQILQKWVQKKGSQATYNALAQALLDRTVMMRSVMNDYCLAAESKKNNNIVEYQ